MRIGRHAAMDTSIIDKLFLELAQITTATTVRELRLLQLLREAAEWVTEPPMMKPGQRVRSAQWGERVRAMEKELG